MESSKIEGKILEAARAILENVEDSALMIEIKSWGKKFKNVFESVNLEK